MSWVLPEPLAVTQGPLAAEYAESAKANVYLDRVVTHSEAVLNELRALQATAAAPGADSSAVLGRLKQLTDDEEQRHTKTIGLVGGVRACLSSFSSLNITSTEPGSLRAEVHSLSNRVQMLERQLSGDRRTILLGQVAGTIDEAAVAYVFGTTKGYYQTLKQLKNAHESGALGVDESTLWQEFCSFLVGKGWTINLLIANTQPLRKMRMEVAHGSTGEKGKVTAEELKIWAAEKLGPSSVGRVGELVELVSAFTKPGQPLVCVDNVRESIRAQQQQQ